MTLFEYLIFGLLSSSLCITCWTRLNFISSAKNKELNQLNSGLGIASVHLEREKKDILNACILVSASTLPKMWCWILQDCKQVIHTFIHISKIQTPKNLLGEKSVICYKGTLLWEESFIIVIIIYLRLFQENMTSEYFRAA